MSRDRRLLVATAVSLGLALGCTSPAVAAVSFAPARDFPAGPHPLSPVVADFNGDSVPDLAVANFLPAGVSILLGDGGGGFGTPATYPAGDYAATLAVGDLTGDGELDVAVTATNDGWVSVLPGDGAGGFGARRDFPAGEEPNRVAIGDLNGDARPDLVVSDSRGDAAWVLINNGGGNFAAARRFPVGDTPYGVVVGDLNGDGRPDVATANLLSDNISVLRGDGAGGFAAAINHAVPAGPSGLTVGDLNGDGRPDLATAADAGTAVLLADGTGGFGAPRTFPASLNPSEVTIGDLNGDAKPDLITSSIGINGAADDAEEGISLLLGDAAGGFVSAGFIRVGVSDMTVGDLNGDAKADLIAADPSFSRVSVLLNTSQPGAAGPTSLTFPVQDVGTQSSSRPVLITSTGDAVLHPRPATASGDFLVASDGCTARAIPSGGTCTITVRFAPTGSGTRTGTLTVPSDDPASPLTIALSGIAPPQTTITSGPTTVTKDPAPAFSFASDQPGTFECRVDQQPFADCVSPHTSAALADGDHTFQVRAIDQAGNADPTPASHGFTVDTRAPETTITTGPSGPTDDSTPTYGFAADTPATFECRVDGRPFAPCSSPYTTPELSAGDQGAHTFAVRATDVAGNTDPTPATRSIVVTAQTRLIAEPAVLRLSGLTLTIGTLTARLEDASTHAPVAGRTIAFMSVDGRPICSAVTDGAGVARCSTSRSLLQVLLGGGYLARFAGDGGRYAPSGARGELIGA